jgi:hypothetical protein
MDIVVPDGNGQPVGQLTAQKTHCNGGTFDAALSICPIFVFTKVDDPQNQLFYDYCVDCPGNFLTFQLSNMPWTHEVTANLSVPNPVCTEFFPGVQDLVPNTECDCNNNNINDVCDPDDDGDGVPNDCDNCPNDPNPDQSDLDADDIGDVCDPCTDQDGDGYGIDVGNGIDCPNGTEEDCDDDNSNVNPGAAEVCDDLIDNDCDGLADCDDPDCDGDPNCL